MQTKHIPPFPLQLSSNKTLFFLNIRYLSLFIIYIYHVLGRVLKYPVYPNRYQRTTKATILGKSACEPQRNYGRLNVVFSFISRGLNLTIKSLLRNSFPENWCERDFPMKRNSKHKSHLSDPVVNRKIFFSFQRVQSTLLFGYFLGIKGCQLYIGSIINTIFREADTWASCCIIMRSPLEIGGLYIDII